MIRIYHNHKPQTIPWHHEEEPLSRHETPGRQIKQRNQLSLPHQDDCNTRMDISNVLANMPVWVPYGLPIWEWATHMGVQPGSAWVP